MRCRRLARLLLGAVLLLVPGGSAAQQGAGSGRATGPALEAGERVRVRYLQVLGNTVLTEAELIDLARPYLGRELGLEELAALRDTLTRAYVERGYVTSGAVIPRQSLADGVLEIWIVEGAVRDVDVSLRGRPTGRQVRGRAAGTTAVR